MSDATKINRFLHEKVMGNCLHDPEKFNHGTDDFYFKCRKCGSTKDVTKIHPPDYCSSLDAMAEVEAKVIELKGKKAYGEALANEFGGEAVVGVMEMITAPASVRAMACAKVCGFGEE